MKRMKKIFLLVLVVLCCFALTGCGNVKGELPDLMEKLYEGIPDEKKPMMLQNTEVDSNNIEYYLGTKDIKYKEALASESGIGSIAHSVVLVRVSEDADVNDVKEKIKSSIDPNKWICVGVEDRDDVIVENKGDLVVLILVNDKENREKLEENFKKLK